MSVLNVYIRPTRLPPACALRPSSGTSGELGGEGSSRAEVC